MTENLLALTSDIVIAHVSNNRIDAAALPSLIRSTYAALTNLGQPAAVAEPAAVPAVAIRASIKPDYLICLEDGKKLKMLKRYLRATYDMSPDDYRAKWGLPADYPMVAPNYSDRRRTIAQSIGLGQIRTVATADEPEAQAPAEPAAAAEITMTSDDTTDLDVAESTPAPARPKAPRKPRAAKAAPVEAAPDLFEAPAADPAPVAKPARTPRAAKAAPADIAVAAPVEAPAPAVVETPVAEPAAVVKPARKPRAAKAAPVEAPAIVAAPAPVAAEAPLAEVAESAPIAEAPPAEPTPAPEPVAEAAPAPAVPAKPERKRLSIVLNKAPKPAEIGIAAPPPTTSRPSLRRPVEAPVIAPPPPAATEESIEEGSALIAQAIDARRCLRWVYNRTLMLVAPYVLYTSRGDLFVDAIAYEKNGVTPVETKLGRFKLTGLSGIATTSRPFPAADGPDIGDVRYQEKIITHA